MYAALTSTLNLDALFSLTKPFLWQRLENGDDEAIERASFLMRQRLNPITPRDWERLNLRNRMQAWLTRTPKYEPLSRSHAKYGKLDPAIRHRWDVARNFFYRTTASDEFLIACEADRLATKTGPPPLASLPQVVQDRMTALGISGNPLTVKPILVLTPTPTLPPIGCKAALRTRQGRCWASSQSNKRKKSLK